MAYKKYIRKNGKMYGPYIYHSKRVDGKVISEYHGLTEKKPNKIPNFSKKSSMFLLLAGAVILAAVLVTIFVPHSTISPHAILNLDSNYVKGEILKRNLQINLDQGELLPSNSKLIIENNGQTQEYALSDFLNSDISTSEGNFYLDGTSLSGSGEGYGTPGTIETNPDIFFKFNVYSEKTNNGNGNNGETTSNETSNETETTNSGNTSNSENQASSTIKNTSESSQTPSTPSTETTNSEEQTTNGETINTENKSSSSALTGQATLKIEGEIQGDVSKDTPFKYPLKDGESIEIVDGSVQTETKQLDNNVLNVDTSNGEAKITTDYTETKTGFGKDYLGKEKQTLSINLEDMDLNLGEGNLKISIVYNNQELISVETTLDKRIQENTNASSNTSNNESSNASEENATKTIENQTEINLTEINTTIGNETEITNLSFFTIKNVSLSKDEISILEKNIPNTQIKQTAREYKSWIIVKFEFGNYYVEYSYDSSLDSEILNSLIEHDKNVWLKDLAKQLSKSSSTSTNLPNFSTEYNLSG